MMKAKFFPYFLAGLFLLIVLLTLSDYGINWDEPDHFMRGQTYLRYFLTGKKDYQGLPRLEFHYPKNDQYQLPKNIEYKDDSQFRRSIYQNDFYTLANWYKDDSGHPPLGDILAATTNWIFYQKLGILGDIESYHLFEILTGAILILVVTLFAQETYGVFAGLIAGLSLALYPLFLGESHFNIKDPVETCFFGLTIYSFYKGIKHQSAKWMVFSSIFCGIALGTKFNIIFVPLIILPWLVIADLRKNLSRKLLIPLFFYPFVVLAIFFLSWPYLWSDPFNHTLEIVKYYQTIGLQQNFQPANFYILGFNTYPLQAVIFTTPLVILFFSLIGIIVCFFLFKKEKEKTSFLWLLWLAVPILRVTIPKTSIYGGVRQIMEYVPAMALFAGLGANYIATLLRSHVAKIVILLMFIPITLKMISLHPNEDLYFNPLIGGLKGAAERNFPNWGLSLGNEYRQGIKWFNQNAPPQANLTLARGLLSNIPRIWIRQDINFGDYYFSGPAGKGEYIMELTHEGWEGWIPAKAQYLKILKSVWELKVEGITVLTVWKNSPEMVK